jgi:aspartate dehydrogenase
MGKTDGSPLRVGVAGLGAVGMPVARALDAGIEGLVLAGVSASDTARAKARTADFRTPPPVLGLDDLVEASDVLVEGLPPARFLDLARPTVEAGKILSPLTVTALLVNMDLVDRARETGARIIVPTGAILGLDAVRAAAEGTVHEVVMVTRKPPAGLRTAPFVKEQGIDLDTLTGPMKLYEGSVRDAAQKFPANVNVSVALALAGIGPDETRYEIWADPGLDRNTHTIRVESAETRFEMTIAGVPSVENPATGKLTPLSAIATLKGLVSPLRVGT